jgi:hypothetical protein
VSSALTALRFVVPARADIAISVVALLKELTDADPDDDDDKAVLTLVQNLVRRARLVFGLMCGL